MADHLLAQPSWAGTLRAEDERALRKHEARLQDLPDAQRAHGVYVAAHSLRWHATLRRLGGSQTLQSIFALALWSLCLFVNAPNNNTQYVLQCRQAAQLNCLCSRHCFCKQVCQ